jgi:peptidoglycan biosynthesis protein MviN/MurJ (putative lipid II flippase)
MVLLILAGGYMVSSLSNAMAYVCQGVGHPGIQSRQSLLQLLANIVLSLTLLLFLGPLGAPLGTTLAFFLGASYLARRFHQRLGLSSLELFQEVGTIPIVASVLAALPTWFVGRWLPAATRGDAILNLGVTGLMFVTIYISVCMASGFVGRSELVRLWALLFQQEKAGA